MIIQSYALRVFLFEFLSIGTGFSQKLKIIKMLV